MQGTDIILDLDQFTEVFPDVVKTKMFLERAEKYGNGEVFSLQKNAVWIKQAAVLIL
ncbi:MAG: hypothetical protein Q8865_02900 [Bacillota bacterium]|nr:hypothetical protein [Bacillota bacterium]